MPLDPDQLGQEPLDGVLAGTAPGEDGRMQRFAATLLAQAGGLVEPVEPDGLEVLAPAALHEVLGVGELCRLGFGPTLPAGAERVGIESDWLGRFERVLGPRGRSSRRVLPAAGRRAPDAAALLAQELTLDNATFRLLDVAQAWTRYLLLDFRFTAMSEEKRQGTRRLAINLATGAMPDALMEQLAPLLGAEAVADMADGRTGDDKPRDLPAYWPSARLAGQVQRALPSRIEQALAPFTKELERRLARDQDRLHAYHDGLHREAFLRAAGLREGDSGRERQAMRAAAVAREYQAKLDDLARKYALRVTAAWVQTLELVTPVHRLTVQVRRHHAAAAGGTPAVHPWRMPTNRAPQGRLSTDAGVAAAPGAACLGAGPPPAVPSRARSHRTAPAPACRHPGRAVRPAGPALPQAGRGPAASPSAGGPALHALPSFGCHIIARILEARTSRANGFVSTCMPGSSIPFPSAAFSAYPVMNNTFSSGR